MAFKQLSKIDERTKLSVHGWIRNKEKSLGLTNIPSMINAICILYFRDDEIFDVVDDDTTLSENKKKITKGGISDADINYYGINQILSTNDLVYEWDLKLIKHKKCCNLGAIVGITENQTKASFAEGAYYAFGTNGWRKRSGNLEYWASYGQECYDDDIISIRVDLKKREIEFAINGIGQGIAFENVEKSKDTKYRLFVCLDFEGDCVEILNFSKK